MGRAEEEKRKDDEKIAKALAESRRISAIRARIAEMQAVPATLVGKSSEAIATAIEGIEATEITLDIFAEYSGEAQMVKISAIAKLGEMLTAQLAHEREQQRLADERAELARKQAELAAAERQATAARAEQERADREAREAQEAKDRAERERVEAEQRAAQERAAAAMRAEQEAHAKRMAKDRAKLEREQAELAAERLRHIEEAEAARLAQEQKDHEAREREKAEALARQLEADHAEALAINAQIDAELAEAVRQMEERLVAEAERIRREFAEFTKNGPGDVEIIRTLAAHYDVTVGDVMQWMKKFDYAAADEQLAAENVAANRLEAA